MTIYLSGRYNGRPDSALESVTSSFNNLSDLEKVYTKMGIIICFLKAITNEFQILQLESFQKENGENDLIPYLYGITETNVLWMAKHYQSIDEWLHQLRI